MGMERKSGSGNGKYGKLWAKVKVKGDEEQNRTEHRAFNEFLLLFLHSMHHHMPE